MALGQVPGHQESDLEEPGLFSEINITPLTDIFLVLLIIFMITSSVMVDIASSGANGGVKVQVAAGNGQNAAGTNSSLIIVISANGQLVLEGKQIRPEELVQFLAEAKQQNPTARIIVQPEDATPYRYVLGVIGIAQKSGIPFAISGKRDASLAPTLPN